MTFEHLLMGFLIGFPMMASVGPISVLLLDQGLQRGVRGVAPAIAGVATADLTLSLIAVVAGARLAAALGPFTSVLTYLAVGVLALLAISLAREAVTELRAARGSSVVGSVPALALAGGGSEAEDAAVMDATAIDETTVARSAGLSRLGGPGLAASFYALTIAHPLALVLFASVVVAGGPGVGTIGWAVGMATASLVAHGSFAVAGGLLGGQLGPLASGRLRLGASLFMAGLAVYFALGA